MAQLIVRNIEDAVRDRLALRARCHGHSMEEEVRTILREAVRDDDKMLPAVGFGTRLAGCFAEFGLDAEMPEPPRGKPHPACFDD